MALTNLQLFRMSIDDSYRGFTEQHIGDGMTRVYQLSHWPVQATTYTAMLDGVTQAETANYTAQIGVGRMVFNNAPPSGAVIEAVGLYSTFSDDELASVLTESTIATGATGTTLDALVTPRLKVVEVLLMNAWKRHSWSAAGGQSVNEAGVTKNLLDIREMLQRKLTTEQGADGSFVSWSDEQQFYDAPYSE